VAEMIEGIDLSTAEGREALSDRLRPIDEFVVRELARDVPGEADLFDGMECPVEVIDMASIRGRSDEPLHHRVQGPG
jgi:hypothetical protein